MKSLTQMTYRIAYPSPRDSNDAASIPSVKVPVRCPHCDIEQLCDYPEPVVVMALTRWNNMNLHVPCHDVYWCASKSELHAIRQHLGEAWIESHSTRIATTSASQHVSA